jgi:hypothetical protein
MYQCSKVCLMHDCLVDPNPKARRFALSAPDLAKLPTLQEKFKSDGTVQLRDVESAIVKDLPVSRGELQQMRQGNGSVLYRTIKKARIWTITKKQLLPILPDYAFTSHGWLNDLVILSFRS